MEFTEEMTAQIKLCESIARKAHEGQTRRDGSPYVSHPERVALAFPYHATNACIAWMHDVIEDSDETVDSLIEKGVNRNIAESVNILTKKSGQKYEDYLEGIANYARKINCGAAKVKIADICDNLCDNPTDKQKTKYRLAVRLLIGVLI